MALELGAQTVSGQNALRFRNKPQEVQIWGSTKTKTDGLGPFEVAFCGVDVHQSPGGKHVDQLSVRARQNNCTFEPLEVQK